MACWHRRSAVTRVRDERIGLTLATKCGVGTVTGNERNVIAQGKQLLPNGAYQLIVITHGEICTPNRARENHITHPSHLLRLVDKNYVTRRVSWAMHHIELRVTHRYGFTVVQPTIGLKRVGMGEVSHLAPLGQLINP